MSFVANTVIKHGHENGKIVFYQPGDTVPSELAKALADTGAVSESGAKVEIATAKTEEKQEEKQEEKTEPAKTEEKTEENAESEELKKRLSLPKGEAK